MTDRPTLGSERANWQRIIGDIATGFAIGTVLMLIVLVMALAGLWMGSW